MIQTINEKMTPEQFIYWLQGFFEISDAVSLTEKQVKIIKEHLEYVFTKGHLTSTGTVTVTTTQIPADKQREDALAKALQEIAKKQPLAGQGIQGEGKIWTGITGSGTGAVVC